MAHSAPRRLRGERLVLPSARALRLVLARSRARVPLLAALVVIVAIVVGTSFAGLTDVDRRAGEAASHAVASTRGAEGALVLQTRRSGADETAQRDLLTEALARSGPADAAVVVVESLYAEALSVAGADGEALGALAPARLPDLSDHADLTDGRWPSEVTDGDLADPTALPGVLPASASETFGVGVGDVLVLGRQGTLRVEIVGLFEPRVPDDPRWTAVAGADLGTAADQSGPLVLADLGSVPGTPFLRWTIVPAGTELATADLAGIAAALGRLPADLERADGAPSGLTTTGTLPATVAELATTAEHTGRVAGAALALLAVVGLLATTQVARLLASSRARELTTLLARGAAPGLLTVLDTVEAAVVAALGCAIGAAAAVALGAQVDTFPLLAVLVVGTVAIAIPLWTTSRAVRTSGGAAWQSGRGAARIGGTGVMVLAAGVLVWRLRNPAGGSADAAAEMLAPGATAVAGAALALALLVPVWAWLDRAAGRMRSIGAVLGLRALARRQRTLGVPLLLVTTAVATSILAAGYTGTTRSATDLAAVTSIGADARIDLPGRSAVSARFPARDLNTVRETDGVVAAGGVLRAPGTVGQDAVTLLGLPDADVVRGGTSTAEELRAALGTDDAEPVLEPGQLWLDGIDLASLAGSGGDEVVAWLTAPGGDLHRLVMTPDAAASAGDGSVAGEVPGGGPWQLLALDLPPAAVPDPGAVGLRQSEELVTAWHSTFVSDLLRLAPGEQAPQPVPTVLTAALAQRLGVGPGDRVDVRYRGLTVPLDVALVTDTLPGTLAPLAAAVDLEALRDHEVLSRRGVADVGEVWIALEPGIDVAAAGQMAGLEQVAGELDGALVLPLPPAGGTVAGGVFLAVAVVVALLAVTGVLAAGLVLVGERRAEVATLSAVGVSGRRQARSRALEPLVLGGVAALAGCVVGTLLVLLTVPGLVELSVPDAPAAGLAFSPAVLAIPVAVAVGGLIGVAALLAVLVRRQAADTAYREETR